MKKNEHQSAFFLSVKLFSMAAMNLLGIALLFLFRLLALVFTKISELLQKKVQK